MSGTTGEEKLYMLLQDKVAVIYGAGGAIGAGVCKAFAREGAFVHMTGHHLNPVNTVAASIREVGGKCDTKEIDALNAQQVEADLAELVHEHGRIDISFNAISTSQQMGCLLEDVNPDEFKKSVSDLLTTNFITMTAAVRHMVNQGQGVILAITAIVSRRPEQLTGSFSVAEAAVEGLCRQLAVDAGSRGIRVVCLRSSGSPDAAGVSETFDSIAAEQGISRDAFESNLAEQTILKRLPRVAEFANAAVIMASEYASAFTGAAANVNCGQVID